MTEGALDNQVRDAISKLSHVHFAALPEHAERLVQMGEDPAQVFTTGDPALDVLRDMAFHDRGALAEMLGSTLAPPVIIVTYHPVTLGPGGTEEEVGALLTALGRCSGSLVLTFPNADVDNRIIIERMSAFVQERDNAVFIPSLGTRGYYSLMHEADVMVGNSSSGIWEAPSFGLPVVNIGERQKGRRRAENVIDVPAEAGAIETGIHKALSDSFRKSARQVSNPYGDGHATARIIDVLRTIDCGPALIRKSTNASCGPRPGS